MNTNAAAQELYPDPMHSSYERTNDWQHAIDVLQLRRKNLVLWQRSFPFAIARELKLAAEHFFVDKRSIDFRGSLATAAEDFQNEFCSDLTDPANIIFDDVFQILHLVQALPFGKRVHVRLETNETQVCRVFHVDSLPLRILCTYRGPGTQWLCDSQVRREFLGSGCNESIMTQESTIDKANINEVLILKGRQFSYEVNQGAVHRSPPIGPGDGRVLLRIDFV